LINFLLEEQEEHIAEQESSKQDNRCSSSSTTESSAEQDEVSFSNLKSRSPFLAEQREILEKIFQESKYITSCKRKKLASELKLTERQIKVNSVMIFSITLNLLNGSMYEAVHVFPEILSLRSTMRPAQRRVFETTKFVMQDKNCGGIICGSRVFSTALSFSIQR
jgi:hypothetical protein